LDRRRWRTSTAIHAKHTNGNFEKRSVHNVKSPSPQTSAITQPMQPTHAHKSTLYRRLISQGHAQQHNNSGQRERRTVNGERRTANGERSKNTQLGGVGCAQVAQVRFQLCCRSQAHGNTCWTHVPRLGSSLESEVGSRWRLMTARNFRLNQRSTHCGRRTSDEVKTDTKGRPQQISGRSKWP
jgi:hypothetical protein